jgi:hypothetical protein
MIRITEWTAVLASDDFGTQTGSEGSRRVYVKMVIVPPPSKRTSIRPFSSEFVG